VLLGDVETAWIAELDAKERGTWDFSVSCFLHGYNFLGQRNGSSHTAARLRTARLRCLPRALFHNCIACPFTDGQGKFSKFVQSAPWERECSRQSPCSCTNTPPPLLLCYYIFYSQPSSTRSCSLIGLTVHFKGFWCLLALFQIYGNCGRDVETADLGEFILPFCSAPILLLPRLCEMCDEAEMVLKSK
jgi:hypothetical protein